MSHLCSVFGYQRARQCRFVLVEAMRRHLKLTPSMTDAGRAAAYRLEAELRTGLLAGRSSGMLAPTKDRSVRRWACIREACEGSEASNGLVAVACGWGALQVSRLGWSRRLRFRCLGWAPARSGMPARVELVLRQIRGRRATLCSTYLDQVLALGLGDERLELWRSKRVHQACL